MSDIKYNQEINVTKCKYHLQISKDDTIVIHFMYVSFITTNLAHTALLVSYASFNLIVQKNAIFVQPEFSWRETTFVFKIDVISFAMSGLLATDYSKFLYNASTKM